MKKLLLNLVLLVSLSAFSQTTTPFIIEHCVDKMTDKEYYDFTKKAGQLTKKYILEDWDEVKDILKIKDKKERQIELQDFISSVLADAREDAMEMFED